MSRIPRKTYLVCLLMNKYSKKGIFDNFEAYPPLSKR